MTSMGGQLHNVNLHLLYNFRLGSEEDWIEERSNEFKDKPTDSMQTETHPSSPQPISGTINFFVQMLSIPFGFMLPSA